MDDDPESPCVRNCIIDQQSGLCRGCRRTLSEISRWFSYTRDEKLALLKLLSRRGNTATRLENTN